LAINSSKKSDARSIWIKKIKDIGGMNKAAVTAANHANFIRAQVEFRLIFK